MLFKELIGQEEIKKRLIQTVQDNRISHAQLFLGGEGSGNLALAIAYAQYINCESRKEDDACGVCPSCKKISKLIHPDLHFVFPVSTTKKVEKNPISDDFINDWREIILDNPYFNENQWYEKIGMGNKQGIISKSESEEIIRKLNLKTFEAEYKTMIIWLPEKMNAASANKLLKLIEEPPSKTLFLLVSNNSERIINTILSRTQILKISPIATAAIRKGLEEKLAVEPAKARDIAHLARGNYNQAIELAKTGDLGTDYFDAFVDLMRLAFARKIVDIVDMVEKIHAWGREKQKDFLEYSLRMIRENYMTNLKQEEIVYLTAREKDFSSKFSAYINDRNAKYLAFELDRAIQDIQMNAYGKTVFLDLALKIVKLIRS